MTHSKLSTVFASRLIFSSIGLGIIHPTSRFTALFIARIKKLFAFIIKLYESRKHRKQNTQ